MKRSNRAVLGTAIASLGAALLVATPPSLAQDNQPGTNPVQETTQDLQQGNAPNLDTTPLQETEGENDNFGWLGLIGLVGLVNLFRKPSRPAVYREPDVATTPRSSDRY